MTDSLEEANKVRKWSTQSREDAAWYQHEELGYNYRMSNIIAGILRGQLPYFEPVACSELQYTKEVMQRVEKYVFGLNIDTIFMHFNADMNIDHVAASRICLTAGRHCKNIIQFQSNGYVLENVFYPTFFVDVSDYIEKKRQALACYGQEHNRFDSLFEVQNC